MDITIIVLIALTLAFDFLIGFHDSANVVSTIIFSRAMKPRMALLVASVAECAGPFLFGVAVAKTVGDEIVHPEAISTGVLLAALVSAVAWNLITWYFGIPSSSSHALFGGLIGAVWVGYGIQAILLNGLIKIVIALFLSPIFGLGLGYLFVKLVFFLARNARPKINNFFKGAQVLTGMGLGLAQGANDAQKAMGIITLGLITEGYIDQFVVPVWVIAASAGAISLGTITGGWRVIKTLGARFYKIRLVHGFATQFSAAMVILGASLLGWPVSSTQVISSAILGVGSAERINSVRWGVAGNIAMAWLMTIPATGLLSAGLYKLISLGVI